MPKLRKVISGGQTGADKTALECARTIGLETGGTAPKGWKIDGGVDPSLADYSLIESPSSDYKVRTRDNVRDSDATVWIGMTGSPGYWCTKTACEINGKQFYINPDEIQLEYIVNNYATVNFAGNRKRINPPVVGLTQQAFKVIERVINGTKA